MLTGTVTQVRELIGIRASIMQDMTGNAVTEIVTIVGEVASVIVTDSGVVMMGHRLLLSLLCWMVWHARGTQ